MKDKRKPTNLYHTLKDWLDLVWIRNVKRVSIQSEFLDNPALHDYDKEVHPLNRNSNPIIWHICEKVVKHPLNDLEQEGCKQE